MRFIGRSFFGIWLILFSLAAAEPDLRQTFAPGQYPGWQVGGADLELRQKPNAVELNAHGTSWARLIRSIELTPGRSYRIRLQGTGPLDVLFRKTGFSPWYDLAARDVFANGPEFETVYRPSAEYPASGRLMLRPAACNTPVVLERFELTPLGEEPPAPPLTQEVRTQLSAPARVRGFVFPDGVITESRAKAVAAGHGNLIRVRLRDAGDAGRALKFCRWAKENDLKITLEFMHGGDALNRSPVLAKLLKEHADVIWAVRPDGDLSAEAAASFRKAYPETWIMRELGACQMSELLNDAKTVYCFRIDDPEDLHLVKALRARVPVPVLACGPASWANTYEREGLHYALDTTDGTLPRDIVAAERELVKNAPAEAQEASIIRAVRRARKPGTLVFGFTTDTHYQSKYMLSKPGGKLAWYHPAALDQMRHYAAIGKKIKADFLANSGDVIDGLLPKNEALKDLRDAMDAMASSGLPVLTVKGNHDDGSLWCYAEKDGRPDDAMTEKEWFDAVTSRALASGAKGDPDKAIAGYFYMDFPAAKTRVVGLNINENPLTVDAQGRMGKSIGIFDVGIHQLRWLADHALNFRDKPDRKEWGVLILCHCPVTRDSMLNFANLCGVLRAFLDGGRFAGKSVKGVIGFWPGRIECDFSAQGPMKLYGVCSGHHHQLRKYDAHAFSGRMLEVFFPCALARPANRTKGTPDAECFSFVVLDPAANEMRVFRYGAGCDARYPLTAK